MIGRDLEQEVLEELDKEKINKVKDYLKNRLGKIAEQERVLARYKEQYRVSSNMDINELYLEITRM